MISFWNFFIKNKAFTYFLIFLSLLAGLYAISTIPRESTPEITLPIAVVQTSFFGASAEDVETLVTDKIEQSIETVSDIKEYTSTSRTGFSSITVEFEQGVDIDERVTRLKEAVDGTKGELPADGNDPVVTKIEFSDQPIFVVSLVSELPYYSLQKVLDSLEDKLVEVDGVADVSFQGIPDREIVVVTDNKKLLQQQIDFQTVVQAIGGTNVTQPIGSIKIGTVEYPLDLQAEITSYQELVATPISSTGISPLLLSDVAEVYNGYEEEDTLARVGFPGVETKQSVTVNISKKKGGDITKITEELRAIFETEEELLLGIDHVVTYDAGRDINDDLSDLVRSGMITVLLVFAVLFFAVGPRESIIAASSIPLSFMLAFVAFLVVGNTINFISLFALILAVGILVDTAIVVVEGINAKIQEGKRRDVAAVETIREYGLPLIAGTMTTIAVFFPLLFLSGIIGQFIAGIPYTVIFVLVASLFVALAFMTVLCTSFLKNRDEITREGMFIRWFKALERLYERTLRRLIHNIRSRRIFQSILVTLLVVSIGLISVGLIKVEFFPGGDIEFAYIGIEMDPGSSLADTSEFTRQVEELLANKDYLDSYVTTVGQTSIYANEVLVGQQYANIVLNINSDYQSQGVPLLDPLKEEIAAAQLFQAELVADGGGPPTGSAIEVNISSEDTKQLRAFAREAIVVLEEMNGPTNEASTLAGNSAGFSVLVDRNAAYRYGVSINSIATTIIGATDGVNIFDITESGDDIEVIVRNRLNDTEAGAVTKQITPDMLSSLYVYNNRGEQILLGSIISVTLAEADSEVDRKDGKRDITITADVEEGANAIELRTEYGEKLAEIVPEGVTYSFGGEAAEQDQSFAEVGIAFVTGIFLMFSVLILQFGTWRQTMIILSVIPFALTGVLLGLFVSGNALSFPAMLGLVALSGVVVNNSIILVSVFNQIREANPDLPLEEVVVRGSVIRLRPVVLTTVTTIIGISPLLFASAIWAPIGYAIIFGLGFCIFVTLALIPLLYRRFVGFGPEFIGDVGRFFVAFIALVWNTITWPIFKLVAPHKAHIVPTGFRTDFSSWIMTVILVVLLPLIIAGIFAQVYTALTGASQAGLILFLLAAIIVIYVATHIRRKDH